MEIKDIVRATDAVLDFSCAHFREKGFVQLSPVILSTATDPLGPDPGSSVIKTGEIEYLGQKLVLMQSMILHKQVAVKKGIDKIFILSPNIRLEHPARIRTGKHLFEFTQLDFEIGHGKMDDVMSIMEEYYKKLMPYLKEKCQDIFEENGIELPRIKTPFERHSAKKLLEKYGKDWELIKSSKSKQPFWAISLKREFYDKEDPEKPGEYLNYDLIYPEGYCEGLSGAEREHEYERIIARIKRDGLDPKRYGAYLQYAKDGLIPTAGAGFGIERLVRWITKRAHIGEVQLFRRVPGDKVAI